MRSIVVLLLLVLLVGCARANQPAPTPTPTRTPQPSVEQPPAVQETTVPPTPPVAEAPPTDVPVTDAPATDVPAPDAPVITGTTESIAATLPAQPPVECSAAGDSFSCYDTLLELSFEVPPFMGPVAATLLREGGQAGYSYEYTFGENQAGAGAGGRSRDFAEGRGGMFTDQLGFGGLSAGEFCAQRAEGGICQVIDEQTVVMTLMPQAFQFCEDWMMTTVTPQVIVVVDLPDHPLIHGFGWTAQLLPPEMNAEWTAAPQDPNFCADERRGAYDARVEALRQDLPAGVADPAIQSRYDALVHLAESIEGPYVGGGE